MRKLGFGRVALMVALVAITAVSHAQTYTALAAFSNDAWSGPVIEGIDGNFYGVTEFSGTGSFCTSGRCGMVFKVTPEGKLSTVYNFCSQANCADGMLPQGSLLFGPDGNFYGTTGGGGAHCVTLGGCGTVFQLTPAGKLTTLYSFCATAYCRDGDDPAMGLTLGPNGNLYGSTRLGGANCLKIHGCGTIFEITTNGALTTIYNFCPQDKCAEGADPNQLVLGSDGNLYGTTQVSGTNCSSGQCGAVFQMSPTGTLTVLHAFCSEANCADGMRPMAGLVQASNGNFYGTTAAGGANCAYFGGCGTIFEITAAGELTTLYNFCSQGRLPCADGFYPFGALIQASDGNLYGTSSSGGNNGTVTSTGTIFRMTLTGALKTLYDFCSQSNCADGSTPESALVRGTDGTFYGTTLFGGGNGGGTIYRFSID